MVGLEFSHTMVKLVVVRADTQLFTAAESWNMGNGTGVVIIVGP